MAEKDDQLVEGTPVESSKTAVNQEDLLAKTPEELIEYWKNKYLYALADVKNVSAAKEQQIKSIQKYYFQGALEKLFPVLDALDASLKVQPKEQETKNFLLGFQYIYQMLVNLLQDEGVEEILPVVGGNFDYRLHQATETIDVASAEEAEKITKVIKKGYKMGDRVVRPASVIITKLKS